MPASTPEYNLRPRYNRPILRRQRRNDGRRENTHGKTERHTAGRKTRSDRQAATHSHARAHRTQHSGRAGDGQQISPGSPGAPPVPSRSALHRSTRDGSKRQALRRINRPGADGQTLPMQSRQRAPGQLREDTPGHPPAALDIEVRPETARFTGSAQAGKPCFFKNQKTESLFLRLSARNFQKNFSFCLFLRHFHVKAQSNNPVSAPNRYKKHRPAP